MKKVLNEVVTPVGFKINNSVGRQTKNVNWKEKERIKKRIKVRRALSEQQLNLDDQISSIYVNVSLKVRAAIEV